MAVGSARPRVRVAVLAAVTAVAAALPPAAAAPARSAPPATASADVEAAQPDWSVESFTDDATGQPRWRVTWTPAGGVVIRAQAGVITADGRPVGRAVTSADLRSISAETADPTLVLGTPRFALTYGGVEAGDEAAARAPHFDGPATLPQVGAVLDVDPGVRGPYRVGHAGYDLGDRALRLSALDEPVEMAGEVLWPEDAPGRRPLVVFLHGRHAPCYRGRQVTGMWPCPKGFTALPNHTGYRRAARALASHGYVVVSASANAITTVDDEEMDFGALARAQLVLAHLRQWRRWATDGGAPFGKRFVGTIDFRNVGLMGHSRGGEGVVRAALLNTARGSRFDIRAVMPVAPTNFGRYTLPGVAMSVVLPYCDGDVFDLQGQRYFDDARYAMAGDRAHRSVVTVLGANHNYFNSQWSPGTAVAPTNDDWWGASNDPACHAGKRHRLTVEEQLDVGTAYIAGFFRLHLGGEQALLRMFDGSARAASAGRARVRVVAQSPARIDLATFRRPLGRLLRSPGVDARRCAGARLVRPTGGRLPWCTDELAGTQVPQWEASVIAPSTPTLPMLELRWSDRDGRVVLRLPRGKRDLSRMESLTFRAVAHPRVPTDLRVQLTDRRGRRAVVSVSEVSDALAPRPGRFMPLPRLLPQQVTVPLRRFSGLDLSRVAAVTLLPASRRGHAWVTDIGASRPAAGRAGLAGAPVLSVDSLRVREGDEPSVARFTVTASKRFRRPVSAFVQATRVFPEAGWQEFLPHRPRRRVTIPAGARTATFDVPLRGNTMNDWDLHLLVSLTATRNGVIGKLAGRGFIRDDDPLPLLTIAEGTARESRPFLPFVMTLSEPSGVPVIASATILDGTAVAGEDYHDVYAIGGEVRPGRLQGRMRLPLIDDDIAEPTETLTVRLNIADGLAPAAVSVFGARYKGPLELTGTILDDD